MHVMLGDKKLTQEVASGGAIMSAIGLTLFLVLAAACKTPGGT